MSKPKFYQAVLEPIDDVIKHVYPKHHNKITLEERLSDNGECPDCHNNEWWLLPKESLAVKEGGKSYIECLNCGYQTHL